ncbi:imidazolonepropionase-like amidohydrolase [Winogradskyella epiphytica]|uniref:Imidazolonepropionase-like amidohydrolase n=1 Tax=Winogradskyella epiphytica TaxID=262005 RepID=A0A2V4X6V6_9FLAO|nr:amidohydrolase family protein [Winogradskyella epiphytica]PYE81039.1 imidazolonepropionase-like amidohydrolase [Winogradskyella epiphytica]GGW66402.1 amidohydrolase [Winogradskyella epiphytica]
MKNLNKFNTLLFLLCITLGFAQQTPGAKQRKDFAIVGATAHIGNGTVIENSIIVVSNGKITTIGPEASTPQTRQTMDIIDAKGKHVYPGFIVANGTLGLVEVDAVKASDDLSELGTFNPHIRSIIAYNTESKVIESMRPNGVLLGQVVPRGGRISGTSSVVQYDAWNWEDAAIKMDNGIHINWPSSFSRGRWWLGEDPGLKPNKDYAKQVKELSDYFTEAKSYNNGDKKEGHLPFDAMSGLFDGSKHLYINVDDEKGITDAVNFAKSQGVSKLTIVGAYQAGNLTGFLKQNEVSVFLRRVHSRPELEDDDYDYTFKQAKKLVDAGILVALEPSGQMERMNSRNLPFYAGTTAAYGLTKEQALQLITQNPAKIMGIDDMYGTLEVGKSATLFISEGDALDMRTNQLLEAFIDGRQLSLETHQTTLWKRYSKKYNSQN